MTNIKLIQLNVCNDEDLIYSTEPLSKLDIDNFISYHKIIDKNLIEDLNKLFLTFATSSNLNKNILSYSIFDNKLRSITVRVNNQNYHINNLKPDVIDRFMKNKKEKLFDEIIESNADFVLLQEFDNIQLDDKILSLYGHISPLYQDEKFTSEYDGMLSNHILYKKSNNYELLRVSLKDSGLFAEFVIKSKIIKIVSGRWAPLKENKEKRVAQYESLNKELGTIIFMGDTNLRTFEKLPEKDKRIEDVTNNEQFLKSYTIDKNINQYFNDGLKYVARYDRAFITSLVKVKNFDLCFNKPYGELKNEYRISGYISDHFGLLLEVTI